MPFTVPGARHPALVCGYRTRTDFAAHAGLGRVLGVPIASVELVDDRDYHFDLVSCPLDSRRALVAPVGLDRYGTHVRHRVVDELVVLTGDEASMFCANAIVVGSTIVMRARTVRLGRLLEGFGFTVAVSGVGEFLKAGRRRRCLMLALDARSRRSLSTPALDARLSS